MELILNDLSLYGQFATIDDFEDIFLKHMNDIVKLIIEQKVPLYKKSDTYNRNITANVTVHRYLSKTYNDPVATIIKQNIVKMAYNQPYWDAIGIMQSRTNVDYDYPNKQPEPNCFTEAIERKCPILSMRDDNKVQEIIKCSKNNQSVELTDVRDVKTFLNAYLKDNMNNIRFVIEHYPVNKALRCAEVSGKCYTENALLENNLNEQDLRKFVDNMQILISDKENGRKTHWWDSIKDDICEYRLSISDGRELRVLFQWGKELVFLNGFIKKSEKTPPKEIKLAEKIIKDQQ